MGLFNGLIYNGATTGLQSNYYNGLGGGLMSNEIPEDSKAFITVWNTKNTGTGSSTNKQIKLPLATNGTFNFIVDWGDGSRDIIKSATAAAATHTYGTAGIYTVKIKGLIDGFNFGGAGDVLKILEVKQWGSLKQLSTMTGAFTGCPNVKYETKDLIDLSPRVATSTVSLFAFFSGNQARFVTGINNWDTSKVQLFQNLFFNAVNFNLPINSWNTSGAINLTNTFYGASSFNQPLDNWNTSSVTTLNGAFTNASVFNQPLSGWNVSLVTDMSGTFQNALAFNQNIGNWNVSGVTLMNTVFNGATAFNQPLSGWNVSKVTQMVNMFLGATAFNQDIGNWNVSGVTQMGGMFLNAAAFNQNIGGWDIGNVTDLTSTFSFANTFNNGGSSSIGSWNTSKVTSVSNMFSNAAAFDQNIGNWNLSACTNFTGFMSTKIPTTFSTTNLDAIYNGWVKNPLQTGQTISFNTAKYTAAGTEGRGLLTRPNTSLTVGSISNNGGGLIQVTTTVGHVLSTGNKVFISGVVGTTEANGLWSVTIISPTQMWLQGSAFINTYISGGQVRTGYGWTIVDGGL